MHTERPRVINHVVLTATPSAVPVSRALVRYSLNQWNFRELVDDAELVMSELATNAVEASDSPTAFIRAAICLYDAAVVMTLWDPSFEMPDVQVADDVSEGGRGLVIVEALSADWGCARIAGGTGKIVWAELKLPHEPLGSYGQPLTDIQMLERVREGLRRL